MLAQRETGLYELLWMSFLILSGVYIMVNNEWSLMSTILILGESLMRLLVLKDTVSILDYILKLPLRSSTKITRTTRHGKKRRPRKEPWFGHRQ
jgi:hypothetical protein